MPRQPRDRDALDALVADVQSNSPSASPHKVVPGGRVADGKRPAAYTEVDEDELMRPPPPRPRRPLEDPKEDRGSPPPAVPILGPDYDAGFTQAADPPYRPRRNSFSWATVPRELVTHVEANLRANDASKTNHYLDFSSLSTLNKAGGAISMGKGPVLPVAGPPSCECVSTAPFVDRLFNAKTAATRAMEVGKDQFAPAPPPAVEALPPRLAHEPGKLPGYLLLRRKSLTDLRRDGVRSRSPHDERRSSEPTLASTWLGGQQSPEPLTRPPPLATRPSRPPGPPSCGLKRRPYTSPTSHRPPELHLPPPVIPVEPGAEVAAGKKAAAPEGSGSYDSCMTDFAAELAAQEVPEHLGATPMPPKEPMKVPSPKAMRERRHHQMPARRTSQDAAADAAWAAAAWASLTGDEAGEANWLKMLEEKEALKCREETTEIR